MKVSVWSQLEFLYDFRVVVFKPLCCVYNIFKFQVNVYLSLATFLLYRWRLMVDQNLRSLRELEFLYDFQVDHT